jgi:hypothetical protein
LRKINIAPRKKAPNVKTKRYQKGGNIMLTIQDCIELSELSEDEILAIAEHEHIPEMAAVEMGNYLCHTPSGEKRIRKMIIEDIQHARERGDAPHAAMLKTVLKHYIAEHHLATPHGKA